MPPYLLPDKLIEGLGTDMIRTARDTIGLADLLAATVVRDRWGGCHTHAFQPTFLTTHQVAKQPAFLVQIARAELLIGFVTCLRAFEGLAVDELSAAV